MNRRALLKGASAAALMAAVTPAFAQPRHLRDVRIERLIAAMSIEEKAGQLSIFGDPVRGGTVVVNPNQVTQGLDEVKARIRKGELTGLYNGIGVAAGREMQRVAVEETRSKIPLIFGGDIIHGMRTQFPIPLGEAASFDPTLAERTARAAALEATALGIQWTFAPMVDVARDQRWGRVAETSGEDTWLGCRFAEARVRGFQGDDLKSPRSMLACPKHFAAYGAVQGGMEYNTVDIPETTLREMHLPPFKAAFDAGAITTMSSFNDIGGVPSTANHHLLTDILRGEWGMPGLVVSDYTSDEELILHGFAADGADAVAKSIVAGCDISMQSNLYNKHLPDLVRSGRVPVAVVDEAVRRVLRVKAAIGLFDDPYRSLDRAREVADLRRPETVALSREAGRKSLVLLKNEGDLLPLAKDRSIALIGPVVSDRADLPGPWVVFPDIPSHVTIEEGFRAAMGKNPKLRVVRGCDFEAPIAGGIDEAVKAAKASDVVVLVVGESSAMSGEAQSRVDIGVPAPQLALAEAIAATGKPMVVLLRHGRALALTGAVRDAPAILATWFLGSETGNAIADVVFGDVAPQGRLPVSFPQASGQEPYYYNHRQTGRPQLTDDKNYKARYREVTNAALYPFGHGLTYSTASYSATSVSTAQVARGGTVTVTATVTNTGKRRMQEVAQLYIHPQVASITQPVRALKGFKHLDLDPGESATVIFTLTAADLGYVHADLKRYADAGAFDVWIAPSAVAGDARPVRAGVTPALRRIGAVEAPVVTVDAFTDEVDAIVDLAAALAPFPRAGNYYPGVRRLITAADEAANAYVRRAMETAAPFIGGGFDAERFDLVQASFSMVTEPPAALSSPQRAPHFDSTDPDYLALLHYLGDTPGTAFYRQRTTRIERVDAANVDRFVASARAESAARTGYITQGDAQFDQIGTVEGKRDRLVIYQGALLHSGIIPADMTFSGDPRKGRLTANFFVKVHR